MATGLFSGEQDGPMSPDVLAGLDEVLSRMRANATARGNEWNTILQDSMAMVQGQPGPQMAPVPNAPNPYGSMASIFAASLADQMGVNGAASTAQARISGQQQAHDKALAENRDLANQSEREKNMQLLNLHLKINEAKMRVAEKMGDIDELEARIKSNFAIQTKMQQMREEAKAAAIQQQTEATLAAIKARGSEERKNINYRTMLKVSVDDPKASDGLKLWGRAQLAIINSKDEFGEYQFTPEEREAKALKVYQEFQDKFAEEQAAAKGLTDPTPDSNDLFNGLNFDKYIQKEGD